MAQPAVSDNPLDFITCIVYVRQGHAPSERLRQSCAGRLDVLMQDVDAIEGERPSWLRGVPTVVTCPGHQVITGTAAIQYIDELNREPAPPAQTARGMALDEEDLAVGDDMSSLFRIQDDEIPPTTDGRYVDQPREKQNAQSLEALIRRRGGQAPSPAPA